MIDNALWCVERNVSNMKLFKKVALSILFIVSLLRCTKFNIIRADSLIIV